MSDLHTARRIGLLAGALGLSLAGCAGLQVPSGPLVNAPAERIDAREGFASSPTKTLASAGFTVTTAAGSTRNHADGPGATAKFNSPQGVAVDAQGAYYVADAWSHAIRKVVLDDKGVATVSTVAGAPQSPGGFADGDKSTALFSFPTSVAVDGAGVLYVADYNNHRIRKIVLGAGGAATVSTLAGSGTPGGTDGKGAAAAFTHPRAVAADAAGNVWVAEPDGNRIRKVTPDGTVTTVAGAAGQGFADGPAALAKFNRPTGLAVDGAGKVYVADTWNNRIRTIAPDGAVATLAGGTDTGDADGAGASARFRLPEGVALGASGTVYVADTGNNRLRRITAGGEVATIAGSIGGYLDGPGTTALFKYPIGLAADGKGRILVGDADNYRVRLVAPSVQ